MKDDANTVIMSSEEEIERTVPLDTVCFIIARAWELQGKTASTASDDDSDDDDDPEVLILEDRGNDAVEEELTSVICDLSEEAQADLVALMWLGRDGGDWAEHRVLAEQEAGAPTAEYLLGTPLLADYLMEGLNALDLDCTDWLLENE
ncbi:DUF3775 domain-containing protein [Aliiruegeria lutimaris]|uniref:DUF3775 domain-containing protein n=1 Tax=Aliiruegeria lutimaris TaxID=571298 RepID=A0A1G8QQW2_9RHOB|nr:DUF3775 domain-containing protein [Aliiruegeria lutimaris]SDJ07068.1 Protein of unknown function [Aliiruegeria lutimaris]